MLLAVYLFRRQILLGWMSGFQPRGIFRKLREAGPPPLTAPALLRTAWAPSPAHQALRSPCLPGGHWWLCLRVGLLGSCSFPQPGPVWWPPDRHCCWSLLGPGDLRTRSVGPRPGAEAQPCRHPGPSDPALPRPRGQGLLSGERPWRRGGIRDWECAVRSARVSLHSGQGMSPLPSVPRAPTRAPRTAAEVGRRPRVFPMRGHRRKGVYLGSF